DRVVYVSPSGMAPPGSYSELRVIAADQLVKIPDGISDRQAAAAFLKGLTAWCIVRRIFPVRPGHVILIHAAAAASPGSPPAATPAAAPWAAPKGPGARAGRGATTRSCIATSLSSAK